MNDPLGILVAVPTQTQCDSDPNCNFKTQTQCEWSIGNPNCSSNPNPMRLWSIQILIALPTQTQCDCDPFKSYLQFQPKPNVALIHSIIITIPTQPHNLCIFFCKKTLPWEGFSCFSCWVLLGLSISINNQCVCSDAHFCLVSKTTVLLHHYLCYLWLCVYTLLSSKVL